MLISRRNKGFTLLEVLVALAIFAITAAAMMNSIASSLNAQSYMERKVLAHWIAQNIMAETRFLPQWPSVGLSNGDVEMAGHVWYWQRKVEETADPKLRRVEIEIRAEQDDEDSLVRLAGFVNERPADLFGPAETNLSSDGKLEDDPSVNGGGGTNNGSQTGNGKGPGGRNTGGGSDVEVPNNEGEDDP